MPSEISHFICPVTGQVLGLPLHFVFVTSDEVIGSAAWITIFIQKCLPFSKSTETFDNGKPLTFFESELIAAKLATPDDFKKIKDEVETEVQEVIDYADKSPNPDLKDLYKYVYAGEWEAGGRG